METASVPQQTAQKTRSAKLALYGGRPVRAQRLPYGHHAIDEEDRGAVMEILRSDWITSGPRVAEFEAAVAAYVGAAYAVALSSGTAALHAAMFAAEVGFGDEVITAPLTFCATANCVLFQGGRPVFADVEEATLTIDPQEIRQRITPKTKAVIPVDYAGHPADLEAIRALAKSHGFLMIEDACHALGALDRGKRVGCVSDMTVFSFHPVKHITTGEGGMVTTNNPDLARRLRLFRNHGIDSDPRLREANGSWYYEMVALGYNYRLTDIGCALGLSQLRKLEAKLSRRRAIAERYSTALRDLPAVQLPTVRFETSPAWHLYPIRLRLERCRADRALVFRALRAENIGVNVHYLPVHLHPYYRERFGYRGGEYPVAERTYERLISLPLFDGMTEQDTEDVIQAVSKVLSYYARS